MLSIAMTLVTGAGIVLVTRARVDRLEKDIETRASKEALDFIREQLARLDTKVDAVAARLP